MLLDPAGLEHEDGTAEVALRVLSDAEGQLVGQGAARLLLHHLVQDTTDLYGTNETESYRLFATANLGSAGNTAL